eukprot:snap_masked-scaffold_27-processed-gene-0.21-mRNA-1 protein AED:1.00 eAED:1.00 QI:0/-1/0/0/-1/1/1/0/64
MQFILFLSSLSKKQIVECEKTLSASAFMFNLTSSIPTIWLYGNNFTHVPENLFGYRKFVLLEWL